MPTYLFEWVGFPPVDVFAGVGVCGPEGEPMSGGLGVDSLLAVGEGCAVWCGDVRRAIVGESEPWRGGVGVHAVTLFVGGEIG